MTQTTGFKMRTTVGLLLIFSCLAAFSEKSFASREDDIAKSSGVSALETDGGHADDSYASYSRLTRGAEKRRRKGSRKFKKRRQLRRTVKKQSRKAEANRRKQAKQGKGSRRLNRKSEKTKNRKLKRQKERSLKRRKKLGGRLLLADGGRQAANASCSAACLASVIDVMKVLDNQVDSFTSQVNRIVKHNSTGKKKVGKKLAFKSAMNRLVQGGGGNKSSPVCRGGRHAEEKVKELARDMKNCEANIDKACNPKKLPQPNVTRLRECNRTAVGLRKEATACMASVSKNNVSLTCGCFSSSKIKDLTAKMRKCSCEYQGNEFETTAVVIHDH